MATYEVRTDATGQQVAWPPQTQMLMRLVQNSADVVLFSLDERDVTELPTGRVRGADFGVDPEIVP